MLGKLIGTGKGKSDLAGLLSGDGESSSLLILSGVCCNPMSYGVEERLKTAIDEALAELEISAKIRSLSITEAQNHIATLTTSHSALVRDIQSIFQSYGLKAFPALVINGHLAFYGGVPGREPLLEALRSHLRAED